MKYLHHIWVFFALFCTVWTVSAQQEASFSLYMFNHQSINPAYVGATGYSQITVGSRNQWDGILGAPVTHAVSVSHLFKNKNLGFGISSINDKIGPTERVNIAADMAYHLKLNAQGLKLGVGLKFSSRSLQLDTSLLTYIDSNDPFLGISQDYNFSPNVGFGLYLQNKNFYFGVGVPYFIEDEELYLQRNFYAIGGALINVGSFLKIKPSILLQKTESLPLVYDNSVLFSINDIFWIGPQHRSNIKNGLPNQNTAGFFGGFMGVNISQNLSIGYAYQGALANANIGITNTSHEILLRYQFSPKNIGFLRSPRLF